MFQHIFLCYFHPIMFCFQQNICFSDGHVYAFIIDVKFSVNSSCIYICTFHRDIRIFALILFSGCFDSITHPAKTHNIHTRLLELILLYIIHNLYANVIFTNIKHDHLANVLQIATFVLTFKRALSQNTLLLKHASKELISILNENDVNPIPHGLL